MVCFRMIFAFLLCLNAAAGATGNEGAADRALLQRASGSDILSAACNRLVIPLFNVTLTRTISGPADANLSAMTTFILSGHDTRARIHCAMRLASVQKLHADSAKSAYARAANGVVLRMFELANPAIRKGAADALWGTVYPQNGRALLHHARNDPSPVVAATSFHNLLYPMEADIRLSHDGARYRDAISRGLKSRHDAVVAGALSAYAEYHRSGADPLLRRYAVDKRRIVRRGAIDAYDLVMRINPGMVRFVESRLNDPDTAVRDSVMLALFRWGDHHALAKIASLARTAPTAAERSSARKYEAALRTQPDILH